MTPAHRGAPREVAVTGVGVVCPLGTGYPAFVRRMLAGESGIRDIRGRVVPADFPVPHGGMVERAEVAAPPELGRAGGALSDCSLFAAAATAEALAPLPPGLAFDAVVYGTAEGVNFECVRDSFADGGAPPDPGTLRWEETLPETSVDTIAALLAARGHRLAPGPAGRVAVAGACASGAQAVGLAFHRIRAGRWRRAVAGGVDARLLPANLMSFHLLSALVTEECPPERASRPFSRDRAGFVRSEGAATLVLEDREEAEARGAEVLAVVRGYAHTTDAFHFTEGREDCAAVVRAMAGAVADAGLPLGAIDAVSAHGTSTVMNDRLETRALEMLFGPGAAGKPVTALKSQIGHTTVAAGAIEAVSCVAMLREQTLAPTLNFREDDPDPECALDYVPNRARPARLEVLLSNSFGFGGHNACLVLGRAS